MMNKLRSSSHIFTVEHFRRIIMTNDEKNKKQSLTCSELTFQTVSYALFAYFNC